ncbi:MAG: photosynthetic reaction center subunit M, partial [Ascidiaceihabitans sp.]
MFNTYQNIFNQVLVQGNPEWGMDDSGELMKERTLKPFFSRLAGFIGNAQIGPVNANMYGI